MVCHPERVYERLCSTCFTVIHTFLFYFRLSLKPLNQQIILFLSVSAPSPSIIHVFNMQHGAEREKSPEMRADFVCPTCVYLYFLFIFTPTDLNVSVI